MRARWEQIVAMRAARPMRADRCHDSGALGRTISLSSNCGSLACLLGGRLPTAAIICVTLSLARLADTTFTVKPMSLQQRCSEGAPECRYNDLITELPNCDYNFVPASA